MTIEAESVAATPAPATPANSPSPPSSTPPPTAAAAPIEVAAGEPASPAAEERLTPRFRELARREKALVEREKALKTQEATYRTFEERRAKTKEEPGAALELLGVTLDDLVQAYLPKQPETVEQRVARLEAEAKAKEAETSKAAQSAQDAELQAVVDAAHARWKEEIDKSPDFELVVAQRAHPVVFQLVEDWFTKHGELLPIADAARIVEEQLFEQAKAELPKLKKLRALFGPEPSATTGASATTPAGAKPVGASAAPPKNVPSPIPTLTNRTDPPAPQAAPSRPETREERIARIVAAHKAGAAKTAATG